ncbi:GntR family transcriptional regulator [Yersinia alsatica]|uniref:GntR family transcriptional regulator n=1 Tax=Yersinia alsatica TaxID=2890317 RepID=UPI00119D66EE|nr:GntR family transcriptional regulator [Yersinia alsatica]
MITWDGRKIAYFTDDQDDHIYNALVTAIVEHQLLPGSKLPEVALADVFGISRTGIRSVLQRLAAEQLVTLMPKRGAQVTTPGIDGARDVFNTRRMLECANLPAVVAHCQPLHITALEQILSDEQQAHQDYQGAAAIRLSALFHLQLQAIAGNGVLTEMVSQLTLRSSLVIAAYGAPWQQGCRCHDHHDLVALLKQGDAASLSTRMAQHFDEIVASLNFIERDSHTPDFGRIFSHINVANISADQSAQE